ncbi:MAG: phosphopantetheine-binding protein [Colwellia sp.]|nr:phosphopantetheine-binding protein [Colwellia sp.]
MNKQEIVNRLAKILMNMMPSYGQAYWQEDSELFGVLPEFDSMSIVTLIGEIEDIFDILIDDEDIDAENFETIGALASLIMNMVNSID